MRDATIADVLAGRARWCVVTGDMLGILTTIPSGTIGGIVTDPPYSSGGMVRGDRMQSTRDKYQQSDVITEHATFSGDNRDQRSFAYWCALWLSECRRVTVPGAMACMFTDWRQLPSTTDAMQAGGWVWRGIVPWDKIVARPMPGRFRAQAEYLVWGTNGPRDFSTDDGAVYGDGVLRVRTPTTDEREHATQKPVELMQTIIDVAVPAGGIVLDPFGGSGTTGVAAILQGRRTIVIEQEPGFAAIARRRIAEAADTLWTPPAPRTPDAELFGA